MSLGGGNTTPCYNSTPSGVKKVCDCRCRGRTTEAEKITVYRDLLKFLTRYCGEKELDGTKAKKVKVKSPLSYLTCLSTTYLIF
jgi:hypothetical protein